MQNFKQCCLLNTFLSLNEMNINYISSTCMYVTYNNAHPPSICRRSFFLQCTQWMELFSMKHTHQSQVAHWGGVHKRCEVGLPATISHSHSIGGNAGRPEMNMQASRCADERSILVLTPMRRVPGSSKQRVPVCHQMDLNVDCSEENCFQIRFIFIQGYISLPSDTASGFTNEDFMQSQKSVLHLYKTKIQFVSVA